MGLDIFELLARLPVSSVVSTFPSFPSVSGMTSHESTSSQPHPSPSSFMSLTAPSGTSLSAGARAITATTTATATTSNLTMNLNLPSPSSSDPNIGDIEEEEIRLRPRFYYGGVSSSLACLVTHPLDTIKVIIQTPNAGTQSKSIMQTVRTIVKQEGVLALQNGLTADVLRQMTYSLVRFGLYETFKSHHVGEITFPDRVMYAGISGAIGGFMGTPADMINVRMQNDIKLPKHLRRNYKHALDGIWRVWRLEGFKSLFRGAVTATSRSVLMTIGQLSCYDIVKIILLHKTNGHFHDNLYTHFTSSLCAAAVATTITQPIDVVKTRMMNSSKGDQQTITQCVRSLIKNYGVLGFFKGYIPRFVRLAPHTILTFVFFEQMRINYGISPDPIPSSEDETT